MRAILFIFWGMGLRGSVLFRFSRRTVDFWAASRVNGMCDSNREADEMEVGIKGSAKRPRSCLTDRILRTWDWRVERETVPFEMRERVVLRKRSRG